MRVLDHVAGQDPGDVFVATNYSDPLEVGDFVVVRIHDYQDHIFLHGTISVVFDEDELDAVDPTGLDHVWRFPTTDYQTFLSDLAYTWDNFEEECPDNTPQFPMDSWSEDEIHEYYFGEPICPPSEAPDPGVVNQGE